MRRSTRRWLFSWRSLRACLQISVAAAGEVIFRQIALLSAPPDLVAILVRFVEVLLLLYPFTYFGIPLLMHFARLIVAQFAEEKPEYPCPVCGYDIRETPHRCPECGTKLRWGQLP